MHRTIWAHTWYDMWMKKYDKFSYPQQENSDQQRSAVRITHSYLMKWSSENDKNEGWQKWAHLFLCKSNIYKSIGTFSFWKLKVSHKVFISYKWHENMGSTMHNKKFSFTFTNVKYIQVQEARTRCWLELAQCQYYKCPKYDL